MAEALEEDSGGEDGDESGGEGARDCGEDVVCSISIRASVGYNLKSAFRS